MLRDEMEKLDNVICQLNRAEKGKKHTHKNIQNRSHMEILFLCQAAK